MPKRNRNPKSYRKFRKPPPSVSEARATTDRLRWRFYSQYHVGLPDEEAEALVDRILEAKQRKESDGD